MNVFAQYAEYAHSKGYKYALPGSYVYKRFKVKLSPYIKLISCVNGIMLVYESTAGRHEVLLKKESTA